MAYCFVTHAKIKYGIMLASLYCLLEEILDSRQKNKKQSYQYHEGYITEIDSIEFVKQYKKKKFESIQSSLSIQSRILTTALQLRTVR